MAIASDPDLHPDVAALADSEVDRITRRLSHSNDWIHSHVQLPP